VISGYNEQMQFRLLTSNEGFSSSSEISIIQEYKGFLWIGTTDDLNRYDGNFQKLKQQLLLDSVLGVCYIKSNYYELTQTTTKRLSISVFTIHIFLRKGKQDR
jgi:hypothetical protein